MSSVRPTLHVAPHLVLGLIQPFRKNIGRNRPRVMINIAENSGLQRRVGTFDPVEWASTATN
jgi:hypothetical protein